MDPSVEAFAKSIVLNKGSDALEYPFSDRQWDFLLSDAGYTCRVVLIGDKKRFRRGETEPLSDNGLPCIYGPMEFLEEEDREEEPDMDNCQLGRDAFDLAPYFDLGKAGVTQGRAIWTFVPGYSERQWATVLPERTEHYDALAAPDHRGSYSSCVATENYLTRSGKTTNGRTFVSFRTGAREVTNMAKDVAREQGKPDSWEEYLTGEIVDCLVEEGRATMWIVLADNNRPDFRYTMRMDPNDMEEPGRPTAWGMGGVCGGEPFFHDIIDLRSLNST